MLITDPRLDSNSTKIGLTYSFCNWVLLPVQILVSLVLWAYPFSFSWLDDFLGRLNAVVFTYMFFLGAIKSFDFRRKRVLRQLGCIAGVAASIPILMLCESIAIFWGLFTQKKEFYIVKKNEFVVSV